MKVFNLLLLCGIAFNLSAQISTSRVTYICNNKLPESDLYNGRNTLHFNKDRSLYIHDNYPIDNSMQEEGLSVRATVGDKEGFPIFINKKESVIYSKIKGLIGGYVLSIIKEDLPVIDWKITDGNKKIDQYNCISATGIFGGRVYDVWFSPDIPVPFGPYKLWGLPGLIVEAKSKDGMVSYTFESHEPITTQPVELTPPTNGTLFTWEEFKRARINFKYQREAKSTSEYTVNVADPYPDYYIEIGRYNILQEHFDKTQNKKNGLYEKK